MKYLVIDAGGDRFEFVADHAVETPSENGGPKQVAFFTDKAGKNQVASYSAPVSWGPAPADKPKSG